MLQTADVFKDKDRRDKPLNTSEPVFIVRQRDNKLVKANQLALNRIKSNPIGQPIDNLIHTEQSPRSNISPAYFDGEWFLLQQQTIRRQGRYHNKIRLSKRPAVPSLQVIQSLKYMIGFLLHRLRSPLTGIQGYTELIGTQPGPNRKYLEQIEDGADQLIELLDELESLEEIPVEQSDLKSQSANPTKIIGEILSGYAPEQQQNVRFNPKFKSAPLCCNPGDLRRILSILIENAIVHAPVENQTITIAQPTSHSIRISHEGNAIPESVLQNLFYPFVTTKARRLGIGLTMAIYYARRYKGSIFLTENNPFGKVSFLFCMPPS